MQSRAVARSNQRSRFIPKKPLSPASNVLLFHPSTRLTTSADVINMRCSLRSINAPNSPPRGGKPVLRPRGRDTLFFSTDDQIKFLFSGKTYITSQGFTRIDEKSRVTIGRCEDSATNALTQRIYVHVCVYKTEVFKIKKEGGSRSRTDANSGMPQGTFSYSLARSIVKVDDDYRDKLVMEKILIKLARSTSPSKQ